MLRKYSFFQYSVYDEARDAYTAGHSDRWDNIFLYQNSNTAELAFCGFLLFKSNYFYFLEAIRHNSITYLFP